MMEFVDDGVISDIDFPEVLFLRGNAVYYDGQILEWKSDEPFTPAYFAEVATNKRIARLQENRSRSVSLALGCAAWVGLGWVLVYLLNS